MNQALLGGATLVTMSRFRLEPFVEAVARYRISRLYVVPPMIVALAKRPELGAGSVRERRHVLSAAAPLDQEVARACEAQDRLPDQAGLWSHGDRPGDARGAGRPRGRRCVGRIHPPEHRVHGRRRRLR